MAFKFTSLIAVPALFGAIALATPTLAQEIAADHMAAAKQALIDTKATSGFDGILPNAALQLKNRLSANNPNRADEIDIAVDEEAIALAAKRGNLENEAARLFAVTFKKDELDAISAFFATDTGQKYLANTPILARELSKAARIWGTGIQRDLEVNATKKLQKASE